MSGVLKILLNVVQILCSVGLVCLVMFQTTKSEGLTGTIGGKMSSSFRGKPGMDEKLASLTKWCAIAWMLASLGVFIMHSRLG